MAIFLGDAPYIDTRRFPPLFLKLADTEGGGPDTSEILDMSESLGFKKNKTFGLGQVELIQVGYCKNCTLHETNSLHLKMDRWKIKIPFGATLFSRVNC